MLPPLPPVLQDRSFNCAEAAAACVLQFYRIVSPVRLSTLEDGADPRMIEQFFRCRPLGLHVLSGEMSVADLKHFGDTDRPVICLVHWPDDRDSHYVVSRGVSQRGWVHYHDVETGPGRLRAPDFLAAWHATGRLAEGFRRWGIAAWPG